LEANRPRRQEGAVPCTYAPGMHASLRFLHTPLPLQAIPRWSLSAFLPALLPPRSPSSALHMPLAINSQFGCRYSRGPCAVRCHAPRFLQLQSQLSLMSESDSGQVAPFITPPFASFACASTFLFLSHADADACAVPRSGRLADGATATGRTVTVL
jgi:hypothetical protein